MSDQQRGDEKVSLKINVTPEMIDAAENYLGFWDGECPNEAGWLEKLYHIMRSLEPASSEQVARPDQETRLFSGMRTEARLRVIELDLA